MSEAYIEVVERKQDARRELFTAVDMFFVTTIEDYMVRGVTKQSAIRHAQQDFENLIEGGLTTPSGAVYNFINRF